eukprot:scaffold3487_cov102-Isochrysis_galbana.AAC.2
MHMHGNHPADGPTPIAHSGGVGVVHASSALCACPSVAPVVAPPPPLPHSPPTRPPPASPPQPQNAFLTAATLHSGGRLETMSVGLWSRALPLVLKRHECQ